MARPARVFLLAGHRVDAPGRALPRFPALEVPRVADAIRRELGALQAGPQDLAITQGANGADLLAAHACLERGVPLRLMLPLPEAAFVAASVRGSGDEAAWLARWRAVREAAQSVEVLPAGDEPWSRANRWTLDTARACVPTADALHLLCLWDGHAGDGPGGTDELVAQVLAAGGRVHRIRPAPGPCGA